MPTRVMLLSAVLLVVAAVAPPALADHYAGKKLLHVDSYHRGNEWNDRIADAVVDAFAGTDLEVRVVHMDTKRKPSEQDKQAAAKAVRDLIESWRPDVVTASDDNAARYLIQEYYRNAAQPIVFSGLNWDAGAYGLPYSNVTGMVEVSPIPQIVRLLRAHAEGDRIGFIAEDTETKRKELEHHGKLFDIRYDRVYLVKTFAEWREAFLRAQDEVDMLMVLGVGALTDWDDAEARRLTEEHTRIPTGTDFEWLAPYTLLAVGKVPEEQGRWMAEAAAKILHGTPPSAIPLAYNKEGELFFNRRIAERLGIREAPPLAREVP